MQLRHRRLSSSLSNQAEREAAISLGIGDDCALLAPLSGERLAVSTDMLIAGRHFFEGTDPHSIGHKALAVNLSDLAAMGAQPLGFTLALAMPDQSPSFLEAFSSGLFELASRFDCPLIGGDTTRGPLAICITVFGSVGNAAFLRSAARPGDQLWVTGHLGGASVEVQARNQQLPLGISSELRSLSAFALDYPEPRCEFALGLRGLANAAIDLSDGLWGDLRHIANESQVKIEIDLTSVPRSRALSNFAAQDAYAHALSGGDDYELAFSAPAEAHDAIVLLSERLKTPVSCIGRVFEMHSGDKPDVEISATSLAKFGLTRPWLASLASYNHFLD